jgi:hypothetical protein
VVAVHDSLGQTRLALALDHVGRDEGMLLRTIEIADAEVSDELREQLSALLPDSVVRVSALDEIVAGNRLVRAKEALVGLVASDTSVERLFFEVVKDEGLEEGRLVEVQIAKRLVTYQLVNGLTKEEIVQQKNTHGVRSRPSSEDRGMGCSSQAVQVRQVAAVTQRAGFPEEHGRLPTERQCSGAFHRNRLSHPCIARSV